MSEPSGETATDPATKADLHKLEASIDARFQAVNSRFSTQDRRYMDLRGRLDEMEDRWTVFANRVDSQFETVEQRFDSTDRHIDLAYDKVAIQLDRTRRDTTRTMLYGLAGSTAATASLYFGGLAIFI